MEWAGRWRSDAALRVVDVGGRDINGSPRHLFPAADPYVAVDLFAGPGVDVVCDVVSWTPPHPFDVVLCLEVLEHAESWPAIVEAMFGLCAPGGLAVVTCAGPGRHAHSAVDGGPLRPGEWYGNVAPGELGAVLGAVGFVDVVVEQQGADTRGCAVRPEQGPHQERSRRWQQQRKVA